MRTLARNHPDKLIDLLLERLAFESKGVELYDAVIGKLESAPTDDGGRLSQALREQRAQEEEHASWLREQIRALGGDPAAASPAAEVALREAAGVVDVIATETDPQRLLHALLAAEVTDDAGWELLVRLALDADDEEARRAFARRHHEEQEHVDFIRHSLARLRNNEVLGGPLTELVEPPATPSTPRPELGP